MRAAAVALSCIAIFAGCHKKAACRPDSLFIHLDTSALPSGVDMLHAEVTLAGGRTLIADVEFHPGSGLELTFAPADYPAGQSVDVLIEALSSGAVVASAAQPGYMVPSGCGALTLTFGGSGDMATPADLRAVVGDMATDLAKADLAGADLAGADLAVADLSSSPIVDLASADLTVPLGLVQAGPVVVTSGSSGSNSGDATLPAASRQGTMLVAAVGAFNLPGSMTYTAPGGWQVLIGHTTSAQDRVDTWYYPNNPGGITAASFVTSVAATSGAFLHAEMSEWGGVTTVDQTGSGGTTSGASSFNVATTSTPSGKLGIAVFVQPRSPSGAITFTPGAGWSEAASDQTGNNELHLAVDDMLLGTLSAPLSETESSSVVFPWAAVIFTLK